MLGEIWEWAIALIRSMGEIWEWLITPIEILDYTIAPIYLVVGGTLIAGVLRSIIGVI